MKFRIGAAVFTLAISDKSIHDADNNELEGCAIESRRWLVISRIVEPSRRLEVALHEYLHAWEFFIPPAKTPEERAQFFAFASELFHNELNAQGGPEALERLPMQRLPDIGQAAIPQSTAPGSPEAMGRPDRAVCGCCGCEVMCGSIINAPPTLHQPTGQLRMERFFECDCGIVQTWLETATGDGLPLGTYIANPAPRMLSGAEASRFLAERRVAAGA